MILISLEMRNGCHYAWSFCSASTAAHLSRSDCLFSLGIVTIVCVLLVCRWYVEVDDTICVVEDDPWVVSTHVNWYAVVAWAES